MIKLLHLADVHIGMENYGRLNPETGLNTRLHDFLDTLDEAVTRAIEEGSRRRLALAFSGGLLAVLSIGIIGTIWGLVRAEKALRTESVAKESLRRELYVADLQLADAIRVSNLPPGVKRNEEIGNTAHN